MRKGHSAGRVPRAPALVPGTTDKGFCDKQVAERMLRAQAREILGKKWFHKVLGWRARAGVARVQGASPRATRWGRRGRGNAARGDAARGDTARGNAAMGNAAAAQPERLVKPLLGGGARMRGIVGVLAGG